MGIDRWLAHNLPTAALKDIYPRAMRRLAEHGLFVGEGITQTRDGFLMHTNRREALKWCVRYFGEWEPAICEVMRRVLRPGAVVIDIGANVGFTTLLAAKLVGPTGCVLAFEPCARTFSELEANIALNGFEHVQAMRSAVTDRCGTATLHCHSESEQSSLSHRPGTIRLETVNTVGVAALGDLATVDLIKIDVEGAEGPILSALAESNFTGTIIAEVWGRDDLNETLAPFAARGFKIAQIPNDYATGFYRKHGSVDFAPVGRGNQDLILTKAHVAGLTVEPRIATQVPGAPETVQLQPSMTMLLPSTAGASFQRKNPAV